MTRKTTQNDDDVDIAKGVTADKIKKRLLEKADNKDFMINIWMWIALGALFTGFFIGAVYYNVVSTKLVKEEFTKLSSYCNKCCGFVDIDAISPELANWLIQNNMSPNLSVEYTNVSTG